MKSPASYFSFFFLKVPALLQLVEQSTLAQCLLRYLKSKVILLNVNANG